MNIGLYSALARYSVAKIRKEIKNLSVGASLSDMKSVRAKIISSGENEYEIIRSWSDFYNLSEFRDLIFHVKEHRFTIPKVKNCLEELGLHFCGFENERLVHNFRIFHPGKNDTYDLDKWHEYETRNPDIFSGMYQFWCQKSI
jgi:hypothetical protein